MLVIKKDISQIIVLTRVVVVLPLITIIDPGQYNSQLNNVERKDK